MCPPTKKILDSPLTWQVGKRSLGKREVVKALCTVLLAKHKEICTLISLRVTKFALQRSGI